MYLPIEQWNTGYVQLLRDCRGNNGNGDLPHGNGNVGSVLLLCALDADAMCAARILTYCFRGDGIPYQLRPCGSATELERILSVSLSANKHGNNNTTTTNNPQDLDEPNPFHFVEGDNVRAIMLLNLGGMKNLTRIVNQYIQQGDIDTDGIHSAGTGTSSSAPKRVYVLDSHRPIHLANLHAGKEVVVFVEDIVEEEIPSDGDWLSGDDDDDDEEDKGDGSGDEEDSDVDDSDVDSNIAPEDVEQELKDEGETEFQDEHATAVQDHHENEDGDGDGLDSDSGDDPDAVSSPSRKKLRTEKQETAPLTDPTSTPNEDNGDGDDNDSQNLDATEQSQTQTQAPAISFEEQVRRRKSSIALYYNAGTSFGVPSAWVAYTLCQRYLRFGNVGDLLWLACVGTTDAYLHGRIDTLGYAELAEDLMRHVQRLYPNDLVDRALRRGAVYALQEDLTQQQEDVNDDPSALGEGNRTTVGVSEAGKILCQKDFKFMLLRHWTLYDSMRYSNYVATKLQVYTTQGKQRLKELLARMGFPLEECQQSYAFMRPIMKGRLQQKLADHAQVS
jgi:cell division control protein 45